MNIRTFRRRIFLGAFFLVAATAFSQAADTSSSSPSEIQSMITVAPYLVGRDIPEPVRQFEAQGKLAEAEKEIQRRLEGASLDAKTVDALTIERERLRRLRRDFALTPEAMLEKIQKSIPDASAADLEAWRNEGVIQWLPIDGEARFFRREPTNLLRFSEDARKRRDAAQKKEEPAGKATPSAPAGDPSAQAGRSFTIDDHAADIVSAMERSEAVELLPVRLRARHTVTVKPGVVPEGKTIRCWIPYPQEYRQQKDVRFLAASPEKHVLAPNGSPQRTVYLEQPAPAAGQTAQFMIEYEYTLYAYAPKADPARVTAIDSDDPALKPYLGEQPPHLLLTPEIKSLAASIVGEETNPYRKAEKIFRWMDANIRYASEMEYSVMPSVLEKVARTRKGDCGVHVLMFAALCRSVGVPARWQSGWATRPGSWNLHDWGEFYIPPYGWLPADPSFGLRDNATDPRVRDYYFGHLDSYRMIANLEFDAPFDPPKKHWRSDPVDNQRGEVEWEGGNLYYDDWDYDVEIDYLQQYRDWK